MFRSGPRLPVDILYSDDDFHFDKQKIRFLFRVSKIYKDYLKYFCDFESEIRCEIEMIDSDTADASPRKRTNPEPESERVTFHLFSNSACNDSSVSSDRDHQDDDVPVSGEEKANDFEFY